MMLLRTVPLISGESPFSHLIRVTAENREATPVRLLRHFQSYSRNGLLAGLIDVRAFARACGVPMAELSGSFDVFRRKDRSGGSIMGVPVLSGGIRPLADAVFCLQCARADGYIEAVWHLANYSCCAKHGHVPRVHCSRCGDGASWNRPSLFNCRCGGVLIAGEGRRPSVAEIAVCGLMRRALVGDKAVVHADKMPIEELKRVQLMDLQLLVRFFASQTVEAKRTATRRVSQDIFANTEVGAAAFWNWPLGFRSALEAIEKIRGKPLHEGSGRRNWIMHMLGLTGEMRPELQFIREQIESHLRIPKRARVNVAAGVTYFGVAETAKELGVDHRTLIKACRNGAIACAKGVRNGREGLVVDRSSVPAHLLKPGRPIEYRDAARLVGIPVRLLRAAGDTGIFERSLRAFRLHGASWAREDITRIRRILDESGSRGLRLRGTSIESLVQLRRVLRESFLCVEYRLFLLKQYVLGDMATVSKGKGFDGVYVAKGLRSILAQDEWRRSCRKGSLVMPKSRIAGR